MNELIEKLKEAMRQVGDGETTAYNSIAEVIEALTALPVSEQEPYGCPKCGSNDVFHLYQGDNCEEKNSKLRCHKNCEFEGEHFSHCCQDCRYMWSTEKYRSPVCADKDADEKVPVVIVQPNLDKLYADQEQTIQTLREALEDVMNYKATLTGTTETTDFLAGYGLAIAEIKAMVTDRLSALNGKEGDDVPR